MNRQLETFKEGEDHVKVSHFTKKGMDIRGIIHVGTNDWYEYQWYKKMGIDNLMGFEPLPDAVKRFTDVYDGVIFPIALSDKDGFMNLHVASGDGQSSSAYEYTKEYKSEFPTITTVGDIKVRSYRFDTWYEEFISRSMLKFGDYNCLVVDVEGMELQVLKGFGKYLQQFDMLNVECSGISTYIGGPIAWDVIDYLQQQGFYQETPIESHNDIMFIKGKKNGL